MVCGFRIAALGEARRHSAIVRALV